MGTYGCQWSKLTIVQGSGLYSLMLDSANDPKHTSKATPEFLKAKKWSSQLLNYNLQTKKTEISITEDNTKS